MKQEYARENKREKNREWKHEHINDIEIRARKIAWAAKDQGILIEQPCEVCGTKWKI